MDHSISPELLAMLQSPNTPVPGQSIKPVRPMVSQKARVFNRTTDMDMPTLKRERQRLLLLQERHEKQIISLTNELKQMKLELESVEEEFTHTKEELQQVSKKNETMVGLLKEVGKDNKHLKEKNQKRNLKLKQAREELDQTKFHVLEVTANNKCLQGKYEEEMSIYMHTTAEMEHQANELQVQLKQALAEYKCLEDKYQDMLVCKRTAEELQVQLIKVVEENNHLELKHQDEMSKQEHARGELHQMIKELQLQLKEAEKDKMCVEEKYQNEKDKYERARGEFEELQNQATQAEEDKEYLRMGHHDELQNIRKQLEQHVEELQDQLKMAEEKYLIEVSKHMKTREEISTLQVQVKLAEEECLEAKQNEMLSTTEFKRATEELRYQLKQADSNNKCLEKKYQQELSQHTVVCEELDKARGEKNDLLKKLEEFEQQKEKEMGDKDLQIQHLQANEKKLNEDLRTRERADTENTDCIQHLKDNLHGCRVFMRYLLNTRNKLEENLSEKDKYYKTRERRYVKLVNMQIQKQQQARKKIRSPKTWTEKLAVWWNKEILSDSTDVSREEPGCYPDDWRLPDNED